jgi:hypothetical protein
MRLCAQTMSNSNDTTILREHWESDLGEVAISWKEKGMLEELSTPPAPLDMKSCMHCGGAWGVY